MCLWPGKEKEREVGKVGAASDDEKINAGHEEIHGMRTYMVDSSTAWSFSSFFSWFLAGVCQVATDNVHLFSFFKITWYILFGDIKSTFLNQLNHLFSY